MNVNITAIIQKEENWYVAKSIENGVASQGKSIDEALLNLREAITLYYEDIPYEMNAEPIFVTTLEVAI